MKQRRRTKKTEQKSKVKIHCISGFREVGSNAVLVEGKNTSILLDFGLKVDSGESPKMPAVRPDALFISHGHLDHTGVSPAIFRKFGCPIYGTRPTLDLSELILFDSIKVARIRGIGKNFSRSDVISMKKRWKTIEYGKTVIVKDAKVTAYDAGHIPGSCIFLVEIDGKKIVYSGDFKVDQTMLVGGMKFNLKNPDVLLMETTYSSREHQPREESEKKLFRIVRDTVKAGGIAIVASFAIRAPEILLILDKFKPDFPISMDGMAKASTKISLKNKDYLKNKTSLERAFKRVSFLESGVMRNAALKRPGAIITTGGCLDGGPAVFFIKHLYTDVKSSLILTGYQIPKTAGRYLVDTGRYVNDEVDLKLKIPLHQLDFSGHAGRSELMRFVKKVQPKMLIAMHGEHCQRFATEIRGRFNIEAVAPKAGDVLEI